MKRKEILDDLELHIDPKPITKDEKIALSSFIKSLKENKVKRPAIKHNLRRKTTQIQK